MTSAKTLLKQIPDKGGSILYSYREPIKESSQGVRLGVQLGSLDRYPAQESTQGVQLGGPA